MNVFHALWHEKAESSQPKVGLHVTGGVSQCPALSPVPCPGLAKGVSSCDSAAGNPSPPRPRSIAPGARHTKGPQLRECTRKIIAPSGDRNTTSDCLSWRNCCLALGDKDSCFPQNLLGLLFFRYLFSYSIFAKALQGFLQPLILIFSGWAWNSSPVDSQHKQHLRSFFS